MSIRSLLRVRRSLLAALAIASLGALSPAQATPAWPDKPIRILVPYGAGQGADILARVMAQELTKSLGQTVYVENKAGAGGNIGTALAAKAPADGYTFLLGTNATNAANGFLYASPGFDAATDFDAVAMLGLLLMVVCSSAPDLPANGIAQLVDKARAKPDSLNVGLPSTSSAVIFAHFVKTANAPLFGVKYKASAQSMTDVLGGQIPLVIDTVIAARPHLASGKLKALGVTTLKETEVLPGVKSLAEQGVQGFEFVPWDAFFAPRGTPVAVAQKFAEHVQRALEQPELRRKLLDTGLEPRFMGPAELHAFVASERQRWGDIIKTAGIRAD
ncbi:Bug family tripartite tricarboxylate transporter substrate binding protein [Pseudorhodoferax sp.]|uniref:Bug family tripartite tricarboxylate transporter substrate binding protein n=1 Tax=Pseudorhodoferax sp. TaxID=1993553 RepID=UPI002DD6516A|nr:tripartite tricarboxylate transporter substrate-binding protein [Pseudorhodoferax sp.]